MNSLDLLQLLTISDFTFTAIPVLGLTLSFFLLGCTGAILLQRHSRYWAIDIAVGMCFSFFAFCGYSFFYKFGLPLPRLGAQVPALLVIVFGTCTARGREVLREKIGWRSLVFLAVTVSLVLAYGGWLFFRASVLQSLDPSNMTDWVEITRRQGVVPHQYSWVNLSLPKYPLGMEVIGWTLANPLLTSVSLVQTWPAIDLTLMLLIAFEIGVEMLEPPFIAQMLSLAVIAGLRVTILAFDLKRPFLEGVSKSTQGMWFALAIALALQYWKSNKRTVLLLMAATVIPALVNPVNAIVCAVVGLAIVFAWLVVRRAFWRELAVASAILFPLLAMTLLQDPWAIQHGGKDSVSCHLFGGQIPWCHATSEAVYIVKPGIQSGTLEDALPAYMHNWFSLFADSTIPAHAAKLAVAFFFLALLVNLLLRKKWRFVAVAGVFALASATLLLAFTRPVARLFFENTIQRYLMSAYLQTAVENIDESFTCLVVAAGVVFFVNGFFERQRMQILFSLLALVALVAGAVPCVAELQRRGVQMRDSRGRNLLDAARIIRDLAEHLPPGASVLMPIWKLETGTEYWSVAEFDAFAVTDYSTIEPIFGHTPRWPPESDEPHVHLQRICSFDCMHLREHGAEWFAFADDGENECGMPVRVFADKNKCLEKAFDFRERTKTGAIYRVRPESP